MLVPMLTAAVLLAQAPPVTRIPAANGQEHPVYRTLKAGEQRDEGLLRRIVCSGRSAITLVVQEKDKVTQYIAPSLTAVDFIVYSKDFRGPVTCEGFGKGKRVYVTWTPDGRSRRAVAVEFLRE
jgi:hypothetical protein